MIADGGSVPLRWMAELIEFIKRTLTTHKLGSRQNESSLNVELIRFRQGMPLLRHGN
jgi:hypothetical protein